MGFSRKALPNRFRRLCQLVVCLLLCTSSVFTIEWNPYYWVFTRPPPPSLDDPELSEEEIQKAKEANFKSAWKDINNPNNKDLINETLRTTQVDLDTKTFEDLVKKGRLPEIKKQTLLDLLELLQTLKPDEKKQLGIDIMEKETFQEVREKILLGLIKDRQQAQDFIRELREDKKITIKNLFYGLLLNYDEKAKDREFKEILTDSQAKLSDETFSAFFNRLDKETQDKYYTLFFKDLNAKSRIEKSLQEKYGRNTITPYELFSNLFEKLKEEGHESQRFEAFEDFLNYEDLNTIVNLLYINKKNNQLAILKALEEVASSSADKRERLRYVRELLEKVNDKEDIDRLFKNNYGYASEQLERLSSVFDSKHLREFIYSLFKQYSQEGNAEVVELLKDLTDTNKELIKEWLNIQNEDELDELMETFVQTLYSEKTQRKGIAKSYKKNATYDNLLSQMTPSAKCEEILQKASPTFYCSLPHIDWINVINFPSPIDPSEEHALINYKHSNQFNSLNQFALFLKPYGFYSSLDKIKTNFYTLGFSLGCNYKFIENLIASLSLGYSYSHINIESDRTGSNRLYLGPSISYVGTYGYLSGTLLGTFNWYNHTRTSHLFLNEKPKSLAETHAHSYGFDGRLEGGLFIPFGQNFFIMPSAKLDWTWVHLPKIKEELEENVTINTSRSLRNRYLTFEGKMTLTREAYKDAFGYIIPQFSVGAIYYHPRRVEGSGYYLEHNKYSEEEEDRSFCNPCQTSKSIECSLDGWWQATLGAGISLLHIHGFSFGLNYELKTGSNSTIHYGEIQLGMTW